MMPNSGDLTRMMLLAAVRFSPTVATLALSRKMVVGGSVWKASNASPFLFIVMPESMVRKLKP